MDRSTLYISMKLKDNSLLSAGNRSKGMLNQGQNDYFMIILYFIRFNLTHIT